MIRRPKPSVSMFRTQLGHRNPQSASSGHRNPQSAGSGHHFDTETLNQHVQDTIRTPKPSVSMIRTPLGHRNPLSACSGHHLDAEILSQHVQDTSCIFTARLRVGVGELKSEFRRFSGQWSRIRQKMNRLASTAKVICEHRPIHVVCLPGIEPGTSRLQVNREKHSDSTFEFHWLNMN